MAPTRFNLYQAMLNELENRGCAYWNIYPKFYIASVGAHIFNVHSLVKQILYVSGLPYDTRIHPFLVTFPGFGKCIEEHTLIATPDGLREARELYPGDLVWTKDGLGVIQGKDEKKTECIEITTSRPKKKLICSQDHLIFVRRQIAKTKYLSNMRWGGPQWIKAGDLRKHDKIVLAPPLEVTPDVIWTDGMVRILATWIAEGRLSGRAPGSTPVIATVDMDLLEELKKDVQQFGCTIVEAGSACEYRIRGMRGNNNLLNWFRELGLETGARNKKIPLEVFYLPLRQRQLFWEYLRRCDGYKIQSTECYATVSDQLAKDVEYLLLTLDKRSTTGVYSVDDHRVIASTGKEAKVKKISFVGEQQTVDFQVDKGSLIANQMVVHNSFWLMQFLHSEVGLLGATDIPTGFEGYMCLPKGTRIAMVDGVHKPIEYIEKGDVLYSLDDNNIVEDIVLDTFKQQAPLYKLTLDGGYEIEATKNHPFMTLDGWKELSDLTNTDRVAVWYDVPEGTEDYDNDHQLAFLGFFLGDGNFDQMTIYTDDKELIEDLAHHADCLGLKLNKTTHPSSTEYRVVSKEYNHHNVLKDWFREIFGVPLLRIIKRKKYIPDFVWRLRNDKLKIVLSYLMTADGCASTNGITFVNNSRHLRYGMRELLKRFRIFATEWDNHLNIWDTEQAQTFMKEIGFVGKHSDKTYSSEIKARTLTRLPSDLWNLVDKYRRLRRRSWNSLRPDLDNFSIWHAQANGMAISRDVMAKLGEVLQSEELKLWAEHPYNYLRVIEKNKVADSVDVYNLTTVNHNYIADGIITHNTEAGWVGTKRFGEGEEIKKMGAAQEYATGIVGCEEFAAVSNAMKQTYNRQMDVALLTSLDSGYVNKRLAAGPIKYKTSVSLWTGTQPARFDLAGGLGRRLTFMHFIPTDEDIERLREARRKGFGVRFNVYRTDKIREYVNKRKKEVSEIKDVHIDPTFYRLLDKYKMMPYEEPLYERLALGYKIMTGEFTNVLHVGVDDDIKYLVQQEYEWRLQIKKGSEYSQILEYVRSRPDMEIAENNLLIWMYNLGYDDDRAQQLIDRLVKLKSVKRKTVKGTSVVYIRKRKVKEE